MEILKHKTMKKDKEKEFDNISNSLRETFEDYIFITECGCAENGSTLSFMEVLLASCVNNEPLKNAIIAVSKIFDTDAFNEMASKQLEDMRMKSGKYND